MKNHLKVYCKAFGLDPEDIICEISAKPTNEVHHLIGRRMGGRPNNDMDTKENLMALSRTFHDFIEANPLYYEWYKNVHTHYMETQIPYIAVPHCLQDKVFIEILEKLGIVPK